MTITITTNDNDNAPHRYRGVSGGERKRTNIGVHLITDPAVLFLDEPTSGLDSFQALAVMQCIKGLGKGNIKLILIIIFFVLGGQSKSVTAHTNKKSY